MNVLIWFKFVHDHLFLAVSRCGVANARACLLVRLVPFFYYLGIFDGWPIDEPRVSAARGIVVLAESRDQTVRHSCVRRAHTHAYKYACA